ncbi:MAG: tRNA pseudouridine(55) synthase TruB [Clostridia bacterium]|nr:tRNA pseudouridine(55) synthase TruB [Clostridia bacterium]
MSGILPVDKPEGMTSHTVISVLRRLSGIRKIGHTGTLDPMATGVLPICIGRATRAADFVADSPKQYIAELTLGVETDTQDTTGNILRTAPVQCGEDELREALAAFTGQIDQIPPMYSALQKDGRRLYDYAREGIVVEREPRRVTIHGLEILGEAGENRWNIRVDCSKGTYIRTLCHDVGQRLGCGGVMSALRRTKCGGFCAEDAYTLDMLREICESGRFEEILRPTESAFYHLPLCEISGEGEWRFRHGAPVWKRQLPEGLSEGVLMRVRGEREFLGLGCLKGSELWCEKSFCEIEEEA